MLCSQYSVKRLIHNELIKRGKSTKSSTAVALYNAKKMPTRPSHHHEKWYRVPDHERQPHQLDPKKIYPQKLADGGYQYHNFVYYPRYINVFFTVNPD